LALIVSGHLATITTISFAASIFGDIEVSTHSSAFGTFFPICFIYILLIPLADLGPCLLSRELTTLLIVLQDSSA
jgi:hypothetical protein